MVIASKKQNKNSNPAVLKTKIMPSYANFQKQQKYRYRYFKSNKKIGKIAKI